MKIDSASTVRQSSAGEVRIFRSPEDLSRAAAFLFLDLAREAAGKHGKFRVALSGGATPRKLYSWLAEPEFSTRVPWRNVHLFWGDERCVPPDDPESNYRMVREALLDKITIPPDHVHRIRGEIPPAQAAAEYEAVLREAFGVTSKEAPRFDLVLLGLGEEGHTASLFPGSPALEETEHLTAAVYVEPLQAHRVTLTLPVLNHARVIAFLVVGERKQSAVSQVVRHPDKKGALPAQRICPVDGKLFWLLDVLAADGSQAGRENLAEEQRKVQHEG